jgi:hypothetical protein
MREKTVDDVTYYGISDDQQFFSCSKCVAGHDILLCEKLGECSSGVAINYGHDIIWVTQEQAAFYRITGKPPCEK